MKLFIVSDTHHNLDLEKISLDNLRRLKITKDDVLLHLGDFGAPFFGRTEDDEVLAYYRSLPFQILVNLGNHENYAWILQQPLVHRYGARGYQLGENIFAPLLGEIVLLNRATIWFYPGGYSMDYDRRHWGLDLFVEELPTRFESDLAILKLIKSGGVEIIVSHDGPRSFVMNEFGFPIREQSLLYTLQSASNQERIHPAFALDEVYRHHEDLYKLWFFGHHHRDHCLGRVCAVFNTIHVYDLGDVSD